MALSQHTFHNLSGISDTLTDYSRPDKNPQRCSSPNPWNLTRQEGFCRYNNTKDLEMRDYPRLLGTLSVTTNTLKVEEGSRWGSQGDAIGGGCEDEGPQDKKCGQPLDTGKGTGTGISPGPPEGMQPYQHPNFLSNETSVRFWPTEL